jgi:hypothetical protein
MAARLWFQVWQDYPSTDINSSVSLKAQGGLKYLFFNIGAETIGDKLRLCAICQLFSYKMLLSLKMLANSSF